MFYRKQRAAEAARLVPFVHLGRRNHGDAAQHPPPTPGAHSPHPETLPKPKLRMLVDVLRHTPPITASAGVPFGGSALAGRSFKDARASCSDRALTRAELAASFSPMENATPGAPIATFDGWNVLRSAYMAHRRAAGDGGGGRYAADTHMEKRYVDYLYYDADVVVVPDAYPKSTFHFLILPMPTAAGGELIRAVADLRPTREHIRLLQKMGAVANALTNAIGALCLPTPETMIMSGPGATPTTLNTKNATDRSSDVLQQIQRVGNLADFAATGLSAVGGSGDAGSAGVEGEPNATWSLDHLTQLPRSGPEFIHPGWRASGCTPDVLHRNRSQFYLFSRTFSRHASPAFKALALWGAGARNGVEGAGGSAGGGGSSSSSSSSHGGPLSFQDWWRLPRSHLSSPAVGASGVSPNRCRFMSGFHALPSLEPLHMHVVSLDLASDRLRNSKHYNSFTTPFFLLQGQVESHLAAGSGVTGGATPSWAQRLERDLPKLKAFEGQPLACVWCRAATPNVAALREHLRVCTKNVSQIPPA